MALFRIVNQRYRDLSRNCALTAHSPLRFSQYERHANMTGLLRWRITTMDQVILNGLQPRSRPDDDILLIASLLVNEFQIKLHSINSPAEANKRTSTDIDGIQHLGFQAGLYLTKALGIPVITKVHRMMHHVSDAL